MIQRGNPVLHETCTKVSDFASVQTVIQDLVDTIEYLKITHSFTRGIGLAAPQIGETARISVVENSHKKRYVLINPRIIEHSNEKKEIKEGCISFLAYRAHVPRYPYVKVEAHDQNGEKYVLEATDAFAMLLQHEIDHLDGILYTDYLPHGEADLYRANEA